MTDNIKVAVRVRPLIARETERNQQKIWEVKDGTSISQISSPSEVFCFDRVFDQAEDNSQVYDDLCLPIVKSVMQGFNGTVFAYGQTSSGKTFTMMGEHNGIHKGIIQYAITDVFTSIQEMPEREFLLRVSFLEIYNEKVYDLLSEKNDDLKILEDSYGNIKVNDLKEQIVQTEEQIWQWMRKGQKKRRTGETQMNQLSSRSHSVFRMIIESRLKDEDAAGVNVSQLNLVDLAGSENLKQTNSKGGRFKEGVYINLSLSTLIQVISQLSEREDQFINYRNSKLTRLLQNSLGGNALTAIICAVTPASLKETMSTLTFAQRAKKIKNKPKRNEIMTDQALLKQYANKIKKLSQELQVTKEQGKELEEKTKQNEKLKRQIEALKANFVSQTVISKSSRRETWGGRFDARRLRLESFAAGYPSQPTFNLPTLEEEPEGDISDINTISTLSVRASTSKSISDAVIQTESAYDTLPGYDVIDYKECMTLVSELKTQLKMLQCEYMELETFTTLEKQYLKVESELQAENEVLRNEVQVLRERLSSVSNKIPAKSNLDSSSSEKLDFEFSPEICETDVFYSNRKEFSQKECQTSPLKFDTTIKHEKNSEFRQDLAQNIIDLEVSHCAQINALEAKLELAYSELKTQQLMVTELEVKYEKESAEMNQLLEEKRNELEQCNIDYRQKMINLEASHCDQIEALKLKLELAQSELETQLLMVKEIQAKHEKESYEMKQQLEEAQNRSLQEKNNELEECNRDFRQEIIDLEASHHLQIEELEAKLKLSQSELNKKSLLVKELEAKYMIDSAKNTDNYELCSMKLLKEKDELEQCNKNLRQKISDLEASHSLQIETLEAKLKMYQSESETQLLMVKEIEAKYEKETAEMKHQLEKTQSRCLQEKNDELEECSRDFRQKMIDLEASHCLQMEALKAKLEVSQSELNQKSLLIQGLEAKYMIDSAKDTENYELCGMKHLKEKNELEQCNKNLQQNISDLEASHSLQIETLEAKLKLSQSELETQLLMVKELEAKYEKETAEMKHQLEETQSRCLERKNKELEECSRDFRQKMIDLEASHCLQMEALKAKLELSQSELNMKSLLIEELEAKCIKESAKGTENHELCNMKHFQEKVDELEQSNRNLMQKISDLESCHFSEIQAAEKKFENAQFKLQLTVKDLEKKLAAVKNELKENEYQKLTLQAKWTAAERSNSEFKQEITDLKATYFTKLKELEENLKTERSQYHEMALKLANNVEIKSCAQEQEIADRLKGAYSERMEVYIKEACELRAEMKNIKTQYQKLLNDEQHHLKRIKELQDQVGSESLEKVNLVLEVRKEREQDLLASKVKYESIINEYKKKQRQCKDINRQLTVEVKHYKSVIEKIKKENQSGGDSLQHLKDNINDLTCERETLLRKYTAAKQKILDLEKHQKGGYSQKMLVKDPCRCKDLEESNKLLQSDLDQMKAKIISLETNKANMIQEIEKLKGKLSPKVMFCKCKMNSKGSESDTLRNSKENLEKGKLEEKTDAVVQESHVVKPESLDRDFREEDSTPSQLKMDEIDPYLIGGGSGPANMMKCYWLEGVLYQKDKQMKKLKQENAELNSELTALKTRPRLQSESKTELKRPEVSRSPVSPFQESNHEVTFQTNKTPLQQCSNAVHTILGKQALREKYRRKSIKPYEHPPKLAGIKELYRESESLEMKENSQNEQPNNALDMLYHDTPGCAQQ